MIPSNKKIERMIQIARLYYEEDMTQHLIAQKLGISRPLVSQLLTEAKSCGIVCIHINEIENQETLLQHQLMERFGLSGAIVVPDSGTPSETDRALAGAAYQVCFHPDYAGKNIGIGCGAILGIMADLADTMPPRPQHQGHIFPLIGGILDSSRGSHTNELIRVFSDKAGYKGDYLYSPAVFDTQQELDMVKSMSSIQPTLKLWDDIDLAIVNPVDFVGSGYEHLAFQDLPNSEKPIGLMLGHTFTAQGEILTPETPYVLHVSTDQLRAARRTIAICSCGTSYACVRGLLELDLLHTLILPLTLAQQLINS